MMIATVSDNRVSLGQELHNLLLSCKSDPTLIWGYQEKWARAR